MAVFKDILSSDESLFKNEIALDYSFIPKLIPYREAQQKYVANCIKPLFQQRSGRNIFIHGKPGVGKTVACKHIFNELEETTEDIIPLYINCWQKNTTYKIILEICNILGYKFTLNKSTEDLFEVIKQMLNKKSAVFCFDEIDKLQDFDFMYTILEEIYRKSIILITNYKGYIDELDHRIKSRLTAELLEFKPYNFNETRGILKQRKDHAFVPGVWGDEAFELIAKKAAELEDVRVGLYLMRESGLAAENQSSKKIMIEHANEAIKKLDDFSIKKSTDLGEDEQFILNLVRENPDSKIGDLYRLYQEKGGTSTYKTFQRKINKLNMNNFVSVEKLAGGKEGKTTIVGCSKTKKLTEFD